MANSAFVVYKKISPHQSGKRKYPITRITPHCIVGQLTAESLGDWFSQPEAKCSSNYGIDCDGRVGLYVDEDDRAWTSASYDNDNRAVTIECASDTSEPFAFRPKVYSRLIDLCTDICARHGKSKLIWIPDREQALAYKPADDEMLLTVHRWFVDTTCPGSWLMERMADLAERVTYSIGASANDKPSQPEPQLEQPSSGLTVSPGNDYQAAFINSIAPACQEDMKVSGILSSVTIAQGILESGWGESELAKKAHNLFGMKDVLSGVKWSGQTYTKKTHEYYNGRDVTITAAFRAYDSVADSVKDHGNYLATAKNGNGLRYAGIVGEKDPGKVCDILMAGGYATDPGYKTSLMDIIKRYDLTKYDSVTDKEPGLTVSPEPTVTTSEPSKEESDLPFSVRVEISDLNLRAGAGTTYESRGFIPKGVYSITKTKKRKGQIWGKIKPISGWICLDYASKI